MGLLKKKKKKLSGLSRRSSSGGSGGKKTTPLRPYRAPKKPPCQPGCPIHNDPRGALAYVHASEKCERDYDDAFEYGFYHFAETNPFPAITGRLCTACCALECNRQHKDEPVYINKAERYFGDYAIEKGLGFTKPDTPARDGKIAIVGAGPAGMACAYHLAMKGWGVVVFDSADRPGGFLRHVAPFRLPPSVLQAEVQRILDLGVELRLGVKVGDDISLDELKNEYKAVYVAVSAHVDRGVGDRWQASNSLTGFDLIDRVNAGEAVDLGNDVVVLGADNPSLDAARTARRLGANVTLVVRRDRGQVPAFDHELEQAEAEGVKVEFLADPIELKLDGGAGVALVCNRMKLGHPDGAGRTRPVAIKGETIELPLSTLVQGQVQEPSYADPLTRLGLPWGTSDTSDKLRCEVDGMYAGGDVNKLGHVTVAIAHGRFAAEDIHTELSGEASKVDDLELILHDKIKMEYYDAYGRMTQEVIPVEDRLGEGGMTTEATTGFSRDDMIKESKRCFSCGMCFDCDSCWMYCQDQAIDKNAKDTPVGMHYGYNHALCTGCEKCAQECPCHYLVMQ